MSLRITSTSVVGATMILAFGASAALAQAKPKSTKRIPITKEAAGEVVRDTIIRTDTLTVTNTVYRTDTLFRTVTRVDSVMVQPPPLPIHLPNGFYFGVASGMSIPDGSAFTPNGAGFFGQGQLGWQRAKGVIGGRISGSYTQFGQDSRFLVLQDFNHAKIWTVGTELKLQAPLGRVFGRTPRLNAYGVGGWTYSWHQNLPMRIDNADDSIPVYGIEGSGWHGNNGWNAGGGLSLLFGHSEVFVESRVMGFNPSGFRNARQIPVMAGFNWYGWSF